MSALALSGHGTKNNKLVRRVDDSTRRISIDRKSAHSSLFSVISFVASVFAAPKGIAGCPDYATPAKSKFLVAEDHEY
jgi:hypothetical protein|tara:strand:- start:624 stop:857 length:234 start_codon:yes stop_codon:yes gene_type:complete